MKLQLKMPTASSLERALQCKLSVFLPRTESENSEATKRGTAIHKYLETSVEGNPVFPEDLELAEFCKNLVLPFDINKIFMPKTETAFFFDGTKAIKIDIKDRQYPDLFGFFGTADLVYFDDVFVLVDYKTISFKNEVTPTAHNKQMQFLAMCISDALKINTVKAQLVFIKMDGTISIDEHIFTEEKLLEIKKEMTDLYNLLAEHEKILKEFSRGQVGKQCKYCPSKQACSLLQDYSCHTGREIADDNQAKNLYYKIKSQEEEIKKEKAILEEYIKNHHVKLNENTVLKYAESTRESIDGTKAFKIFLDKGLRTESVFEMTTSKTKIKDIFKKESDKIIDMLASEGALKISKFHQLKEEKIK